MSVFVYLIGIFLAILFSNLRFLVPRTRSILDTLRDDTIKAIEAPDDKFSFAFFMSWHQTCHSLERRRSRCEMWCTATLIGVVVGLLTSASAIALGLFQITVVEKVTEVLKIVAGLALLVAVISLIEPCFLVFYWRKHPSLDD